MKIIPVLHNIRSIYNVGAILRTCDGLGITEVALSGYTPKYNDPKALPHVREKLNHQIEKSALGAEQTVQQDIVTDLAAWLDDRKSQGYTITGLENNLAADENERKITLGTGFEILGDIVLILGEEVEGIPPEIRKVCDYFLEIPMHGQKESFNVSVATAIALWELSKRAQGF